MTKRSYLFGALVVMLLGAMAGSISGQGQSVTNREDGKRLFERETFAGNGRTCRTCHSSETGTVSPQDAQQRFAANPNDPLFVHDGSDDGQGHGVTRMLSDATILMQLPLPSNVRIAGHPEQRSVTLRRGIPTTLNTPALDPVLMLDGRQPTLEAQATGAIHDHAQALSAPTGKELTRLHEFQLTDAFFSSPAVNSNRFNRCRMAYLRQIRNSNIEIRSKSEIQIGKLETKPQVSDFEIRVGSDFATRIANVARLWFGR